MLCTLHAGVPTTYLTRRILRSFKKAQPYLRHAASARNSNGQAVAAIQETGPETAAPLTRIQRSQQGLDFTDRKTPKSVKRKVGMYIGYVGTDFSGLQIQPDQPDSFTVETVLQAALTKAGLISKSNSVSLTKVGWSRSSRTDKGVHSICTIISFKMEMTLEDAASFGDEGQQFAARANQFLPEQVRVFALQHVNRSFNARSYCVQRTYHYHIPASVLGMQQDGGENDEEILGRLRACLKLFEGSHPFHNYTKRRLYRLPAKPVRRASEAGSSLSTSAAAADAVNADEAETSSQPMQGASQQASGKPQKYEERSSTTTPGTSTNGLQHTPHASESASGPADSPPADEDDEDEASSIADNDETSDPAYRWPQRKLQFEYQDDWGPGDKLGAAHYRIIREAAASDVLQLTAGHTSMPCIRITFCGNSFVLHQIRHMVAAAAAVAVGSMPLEFVDASLSPCCRTTTPIFPPQTLVLIDAQNSRFPQSTDRLELRQGGQAAQQHFYEKTLQPALSGMLEGTDWDELKSELELIKYDEDAMSELVAQHAVWKAAKPAPKPKSEHNPSEPA